LSAGAKFNDTSPTQRGIFVRTRLLCQKVEPPPPNVNVDQPPTSPTSNCKADRYAAHASVGSCAACHSKLDPIGFGLARYGPAAPAEGDRECRMSGDGRTDDLGPSNGPAALEDLLLASGELERCVVTQLYRFAMGKQESENEAVLINQLATKFRGSNRSFQQLL